MIYNWRWFISKRLREVAEDRKQIKKLLSAQRDLIKPEKAEDLEKALSELDKLCRGPIDKEALQAARKAALDTAEKILIPYPDPSYRDWVEMALVVISLVLAFRSFFFQPFKIPTGSMQPTLYGITYEDLMDRVVSDNVTGRVEEGVFIVDDDSFFLRSENDKPVGPSYHGRKKLAGLQGHTVTFGDGQKVTISTVLNSKKAKLKSSMKGKYIEAQPFTISFDMWPDKLGYAIEKLRGYTYHSMKAEGNWKLNEIQDLKNIAPFISKQVFVFSDNDTGETIHRTAWFPPLDSYQKPILSGNDHKYKNELEGKEFNKGDYIYKLRVKTGDHLFVNRMTYNFRRPRRGDISVFTIKYNDTTIKAAGVPEKDTFYIKRLVGLSGEQISIGPDRHLKIDGHRLNSSDIGFEFVYSHPKDRNGKPLYDDPIMSMYSGHSPEGQLSIFSGHTVPENHYMFLGDNTASSMDSRTWGTLPENNVIGHSSFVYWPPLSPRFGWSHQ